MRATKKKNTIPDAYPAPIISGVRSGLIVHAKSRSVSPGRP